MPISHKIAENLTRSSWIRKMFEEGERLRRERGPEAVFDYSLGNPDHEPPPEFYAALRALAADPPPGLHRYMSNAGYPETRAAVARRLASETGLSVTAEHVVMTCGAGGALNVILKTLLNPGEEVVVIAPYFVEYGFYIENHGGRVVVAESSEDFQLDLDLLGRAIGPQTRAIIINSPNNPTGVLYPEASLRALDELLAAKEAEFGTTIYVISDEPYAKLVYDGAKVPPVFNLLRHSIIATSFSKDLALAGERIGYAAVNPRIPDAAQIAAGLVFANRILGFVNAPALMQRLVAGLQEAEIDVASYRERRDILYDHLVSLGFEVVKPAGTFYLFPKSPIPDDVAFAQMAAGRGLLFVPGSGFGRPGYFRLAYCIPKETILRSLPVFTALAREVGLVR
ncbi:MAG: pyridoxal phosphate-dependent aminotransferase [Firmicutes bacterium]|nr:pyridoxal phosphate-dependent aminotransferase [Bacillota bacterium]